MSRINTVPVKELCTRHLVNETRGIVQIYSCIEKSLAKYGGDHTELEKEIPYRFKFGANHIKFFYNKLGYIHKRQRELQEECCRRGIKVVNKDYSWRVVGKIPDSWYSDWSPDVKTVEFNRIFLRGV